jgi:alkanesulfonate monooxygenase SsuD/methylene tetrahydromethanopterin reductase-like flavin-dependent oxidoreductase (luciferase family)
MALKGIFVAPFGELSDPRVLASLAARTEAAGWDGFFVWDHIAYDPPVEAIADPWVSMAAIACATSRVKIGALVTPIPRRRVHKLARETVTLDLLSGGRLIFGGGIGGDKGGEFSRFGEEMDMKARAAMLDEGLEALQQYWGGGQLPAPAGKIPIWLAARYPNRRPVRRAARYDGLFPIDLETPDQLAEMVSWVQEERGQLYGYEIVVTNDPGTDPEPWEAAGATWCLTGFGTEPREADVIAAIERG